MEFNNNQMSNKTIRCAIYTRKSTDEGLDLEYNSLDNQYDSCENYINSQKHEGWTLVNKRYDDGGFSGGNLERPALKELLRDIELSLVDMVVVYKIDRLSRSLLDFAGLMEVFTRNNSSFASVTQHFNTETSMGRLILNILLSFAQFEREMAGDRIRDKIRAQRKKGMWTGGVLPLGYEAIDKKLVINQEEAKLVKLIYNSFVETRSLTDTAYLLNKKGYTTKSYTTKKGRLLKEGKIFNTGALYKILHNRTYCGYIVSKSINREYEGQHQAIIEEELYNQVQSIFKSNKETKSMIDVTPKKNSPIRRERRNKLLKNKIPRSSNVPYLLKGLMKCECCDSTLSPTYTRKVGNGKDIIYRYYKPNKAMKGENCNLGNIPAEQIEKIVLNQVYKILKSPEVVADVIEETKKHNNFLNIKEVEIINSLKNIEVIWKELFPKEQVEILNILIKEIIVSAYNLKIIFKHGGFIQLINEARTTIERLDKKPNNIELITKNTTEINIAVNFTKRGGRSYINTPQGKECRISQAVTRITNDKNSSSQINEALVSKLIQAEEWRQELLKNRYLSLSQIAERENKGNPYVCKIYNLNFLAPDIKKAILTGNTPTDLSLEKLREGATIIDWEEQRQVWGFK